MLNVEMQTYTYIGSTIVQIYHTILADIVRHKGEPIGGEATGEIAKDSTVKVNH